MKAILALTILGTFLVKDAVGYAYLFASSSYCSQELYDGVTMMGSTVHYGDSRSVVVKRGSTTLSSGAYYVAGETLTVSLSSSATQYAFQVASGDATFSGGACSSKRKANGAASLIMPTSGTVVINGASAQTYGTASMFSDFTLNCCTTSSPTASPTSKSPTVTPTTAPSTQDPSVKPTTQAPSVKPTIEPSVAPSTLKPTTRSPTTQFTVPTFLPTVTPTITPTVGPTQTPSVTPTVAPSVKPTIHPSKTPTVRPTLAPSGVPTEAPTFLTMTLITYELTQVVNNFTADGVTEYEDSFVDAMTTSLTYFMTPYTLDIESSTDTSRRLAEDVGSVTIVYNAGYILEATEYETAAELENALSIANNMISNSNLFLNTLQSEGSTAFDGISSTSADGIEEGSVELLLTVAPTITPSEAPTVTYEVYGDDNLYNGSMTTKVVVGVIVGFFGVLFWILGLNYFLSNHENLAAYGGVVRKMPAWLAIAMGIVALILVSCWATEVKGIDYNYLGVPKWKENVFAYHPVFLVAGFYFAQIIAINNWTMFDSHALGKGFHVFFQMCGLAFMITGLCAVVKWKLENKSPSLTSMHSWVGVGSVAIFCVNYINGFFMGAVTALWPDSVIRKALNLRRIHQAMGLTSLGMTTIAVLTGIMDQLADGACYYPTDGSYQADKDPAENYPEMYDSCKIAMGMGIAVVIGSICTVLSVSLRADEMAAKPHETVAPKSVIPSGKDKEGFEMVQPQEI